MSQSPRKAIVMMTAIVPTVGHKFLIDFAAHIVPVEEVHVIVCALEREPTELRHRVEALREACVPDVGAQRIIFHQLEREVPQVPADHPNFWEVWRDIVREFVNVEKDDYFVASELYGIDMANVLGCHFMPCNRYREVFPVSGTEVRGDLMENFEYILPAYQHRIRQTVTLFGAESCGKTTMAKRLSELMNGWFLPEWAREYLETVGSEVTDERMRDIFQGQMALQLTAQTFQGKPWIFQDTDLLSTYGYYRINGTDENTLIVERVIANLSKADFYIVMNDRIPFEEDPLRYGGTVRESSMQFWIDLLDEFGCKYYVITSTNQDQQTREAIRALNNHFESAFNHIMEYVR